MIEARSVRMRRWSRREYDELVERSFFRPDERLELGSPRDYRDAHPSSPALVVEVALASLRFDRTRRCRAFARAGVPEYWIVNLVDRVLEVHREPGRPGDARPRTRGRFA